MLDPFGPADKVYAAIKRLAPQVRAEIVKDLGTGLRHVQVTYRGSGPWRIEWDGTRYRWTSGPHAAARLASDPEDAANEIGEQLGVPLPEAPPRRSWPTQPGAGLTI